MSHTSTPLQFPVDEISGEVCAAFAQHDIILSAPPGAGKSTRIPLALLQQFPDKHFILLQPRRVVVRHLARFLAGQLQEPVGQTIGYRMRGESKTSASTRLTLMTEGVLTRVLQDDPELTGIDGILFDEFHERSIHADLGLAFALESQQQLRPDLRLMVMSATLDIQAVKTLLPEAQTFASEGKMFPVKAVYLGDCKQDEVAQKVAAAINQALTKDKTGNVLVFLPSTRVIRQCLSLLSALDCEVAPLYGALSLDEQGRAIYGDGSGRQRVILATNIAETSLTIEGVTAVIDSGRVQQVKFDTQAAITSLTTRMISQPSAVQRMGRAGRLSAGTCYRLWSEATQQRLERAIRPAIKEVDLSAYLLDVLVWGTWFDQLALIDQPEPAQLRHGQKTLNLLGLIDAKGKLTAQGHHAFGSGFHPRVSTMLMQADTTDEQTRLVHALAACVVEHASTINCESTQSIINAIVDSGTRINKTWMQALAFYGLSGSRDAISQARECTLQDIAGCVAKAYPERVAVRQSEGEFKLVFGPRFRVETRNDIKDWCVLVHGIYRSQGGLVAFAVLPCTEDKLRQHLPALFRQDHSLSVNSNKGQLEARQIDLAGTTQFRSKPVPVSDDLDWAGAWKQALLNGNLGLPAGTLPLNQKAQNLLMRMRIASFEKIVGFAHTDYSFSALMDNSELWLDPSLAACRSIKQVEKLSWDTLLLNLLSWEQQQTLNKHLPESITVGTGQRKTLEYRFVQNESGTDVAAHLAVKMQMMFGINKTITLCNGDLPVTFSLLSPAGRPLQTTRDLAAFWQGSYHQIAKEMRGRYPKHPWPDDPANARAVAGTKKASGL